MSGGVTTFTCLSVSVSPSQYIFICASDCEKKPLENNGRVVYKYFVY